MAAARRPRKKKNIRIEDPRGIRTLAHPARLQAIYHLYGGMAMTATELAKVADVSPSAMSYHLRELAKWGVIRRVEDGGDGRERRWEAAGENLNVGARSSKRSEATTNAETVLVRSMLDQLEQSVIDLIEHRADEPAQWRKRSSYGSGDLLLSPEEFDELTDKFGKLFDPYTVRRKNAPAGARRMRFTHFIIPANPGEDGG